MVEALKSKLVKDGPIFAWSQLIALQTTKSRMKEVREKQFAVEFKGERKIPIGIREKRRELASSSKLIG